jgi:hypothetical protein
VEAGGFVNRRQLFAAAAGLITQAWLPERTYSFVGGWALDPQRYGHIASIAYDLREHLLAAWHEAKWAGAPMANDEQTRAHVAAVVRGYAEAFPEVSISVRPVPLS